MKMSAPGALFQAVSGSTLLDNPGRLALTLLGIALGVALGVAVHLINASALNEMRLAAHRLSGEADLSVQGPRAGFDEKLYARVARSPAVQAASPVLEVRPQLAGRRDSLTIIGIDPFRAAQIQPALVAGMHDRIVELFDPDAILLTQAAADWLGVKAGDTLRLYVGTSAITLRIIGVLPPALFGQPLAIMDIASAQWRMERLGRLSRIDIRLRPGATAAAAQRELATDLPAGMEVVAPAADIERGSAVSRAYRLNLDMLALVAIFTGAFLVFATQFLSVLRRRTPLALLRVIGVTRSTLVGTLAAEGLLIGALGSTLGVSIGCAAAAYALRQFGADLGAGYFRAPSASLHVEWPPLVAFWLLGILLSLGGAAVPAIEAGRRAPALGLRAGDEDQKPATWRPTAAGGLLIALAPLLAHAPPYRGLPLFAYAAIAFLLLGTILVLPRLAGLILERLPLPQAAPAALAIAQMRATPRQVSVSVSAIVTSFSLMVAMLIMIGSFRVSLDAWLTHMLPADLYLRAAGAGDTGFFTARQQERIAAVPGVGQARFLRSQTVLLRPDLPPVTLLARTIDPESANQILPLVGASITAGAGAPPPVWISETIHDRLRLRVGDRVRLPLAGKTTLFLVAGIWRDYARQNGALVISRDLYVALTGDRRANDAAVWLVNGADLQEVERALRDRLGAAEGVEISTPGAIRAASLAIFDRTFAVTYMLEIVAVLIGLFGVSVSFGAQALARRREFGVLRHLGMLRGDIGTMLACEGTLVAVFGIGIGLLLGWLVSLILIFVINRQSFHWSLDLHMPWLPVGSLVLVLAGAAVLTAVWSGRRAMDGEVVRAVREDW